MKPVDGDDLLFEQRLEEGLAARRERRLSAFEPEPLAWLALVPTWSRGLAERLELPVDDLDDWLAALEKTHWIQREKRRDESRFWMLNRRRAEVLEGLRRSLGADALPTLARRLGYRLQEVESLSPAMQRWAELARHLGKGPEEAAEWLEGRLRAELHDGRSASLRDWVQAGQMLAYAFPRSLSPVVDLGRRRLELLYRRQSDQRHLERFLEREEQIAAFEKLLDDENDVWALHYLGMGGVGKTTLLRHLCSRKAPELGVKVARVDFDHLSPDFPLKRPAQLLLELAADLFLQAEDTHLFQILENREESLEEGLAGAPERPQDPLANLDRHEFLRLQSTFIDILQGEGKVVLLLDTCEELAKVHAAGVVRPSLLATFEIVERLHREVPNLRVIFAGRRFLAQEGAGWKVATESATESTESYLPRAKPYLALHRIRGFTRAEAESFLSWSDGAEESRLEEPLRQAILRRARSLEEESGDERFNPFDVALYSEWAREDRTLDAEIIASGDTDPYVQLRIVDRIAFPALHRILPGVALLGRFEARDLRTLVAEIGDEEFEALVRELGDQEWIEGQHDKALDTRLLEVNRHLRPRLVAYLGSGERARQMAAARKRLGRALCERIVETPVKRVGYDLLNNSLRLSDEKARLKIWRRIEGAFPGGGLDAAWALSVCERLLAEGGAVAALEHPLRASVRALHLAAQGHLGRRFEQRWGWQEVVERAEQHPHETMREVLRIRGLCGQAGAFGVASGELPDRRLLEELFRALGSHLGTEGSAVAVRVLPAQVAALESLLDRAREDPALEDLLESSARAFWPPGLPPLSTRIRGHLTVALDRWAEAAGRKGSSRTAAAFASLLAARMPKGERSRELFEQAWQRKPRHASSGMADWIPPESLGERIRLERYWRFLAGDDPRVYEDWLQELLLRKKSLLTLDGDRLASASLLGWLRHETIPGGVLQRVEQQEERAFRSFSGSQRAAPVHHRTPELIVSLAKAWLARGQGEHAWRLLTRRLREARSKRLGLTSIQALEQAQLICMRDSRTWFQGRDLVSYAASAESGGLRGLAWEVLGLLGSPRVRELPALTKLAFARIPERWPSYCLLGPEALTVASRSTVRILGQALLQESEPETQLELLLALEELRLALLTTAPELEGWVRPLAPPHDLLEGLDGYRETSGIRRALRARGLEGSRGAAPWLGRLAEPVRDLHRLAGELGERRLAELAQREGQLLAKRLPLAGRDLLDLAASSFQDAGDFLGAFRCGVLAFMAEYQGGERPSSERLESRVRQPYEELRKLEVLRAPWSLVRQFVDALPRPERELEDFGEGIKSDGFLHRLFAVVSLYDEMERKSSERFWDLLHEVYGGNDFPVELDARYRLELPDNRREILDRFVSGWEELATHLGQGARRSVDTDTGVFRSPTPTGPPPPADPGRGSLGTGGSLGAGGLGVRGDPGGGPPPPMDFAGKGSRSDPFEADSDSEPELRIENLFNEPFRPYEPVRAHLVLHAGGVSTDFRNMEARDATKPYLEWRHALPTAEKLWAAARKRVGSAPVALDVDASLSGFPWEAFVGMALGELPDLYRADLRSSGPGYDLAALAERGPWSPSVFVIGEEPALDMAHGIWTHEAEHIETSPTPFAGGRVREARPAVLHLVGHAAERGGRFRLQLGAEAEGLIEPEEYPLHDIPLVVIQGMPQGSAESGRTPTDRSQAAELRQVAASFFRQGASVVVMVPSSPAIETVMSPAMEPVARSCLRPAFELAPWLRITRDLRSAFWPPFEKGLQALHQTRKLSPEDETMLELALEVTLFVRLHKKVESTS